MARVPASETTRQRIAALLGGAFEKSDLMRQAVRLIIEETLEAEVGSEARTAHQASSPALARLAAEGFRGHWRKSSLRPSPVSMTISTPASRI